MATEPPKITDAPIDHLLFNQATKIFGRMCLDAQKGQIISMVGPTQAGKSLVFEHIVRSLLSTFSHCAEQLVPLVYVQVESVEEGRVKAKWLDLMMLKKLRHPVYMHVGDLDELDYYVPSKARDETSLRVAMGSALTARETICVALDEAHLLTRTKIADLRAHILESLKSMAAINRTLLLCGGYELAYKGLFDHPHFAGRTITYDFGRYTQTTEHMTEWKRILACFSQYLRLEPNSLLLDMADALLLAANGTIGLLEKWLWACKKYADATSKAITIDVLQAFAPPLSEQKIIADDISKGQQALSNVPKVKKQSQEDEASKKEANVTPHTSKTSKTKRRPFESLPRRIEIKGIEIYQCD